MHWFLDIGIGELLRNAFNIKRAEFSVNCVVLNVSETQQQYIFKMKEQNETSNRQNPVTLPANTIVESSSFLKTYGLEICTILFSIASTNSQVIVQNFYIDRICRVSKNLSLEECRNLSSGYYQNDEKRLEVTASEFVIYQNLIENGFPIFISFFLGSWTDKHGSKPIFVIALFGYFVSALLYVMHSLFPELSPFYILTSSVPIALGGGLTALLISGISLITRQAPIHERNFRLSLFSVCIDGGSSIGFFMGEKVYKLLGYTEVFMITASLDALAVICGILFITERKPENALMTSTSSSGKCIFEFFDVAAVKDTVMTCFKRRQSNKRCWILILMSAIALQYFSFLVRTYLYLYTRNKFGWDISDYSNFLIVISIFNSAGGVIMTLVAIKWLRITDIHLGFVTTLSNLSGYLVMIFASSGWLMYFSAGIQMLGAITTAVMRSILSKCVDPEEHGKLFSFVTCAELTMPFVAGSVYGLIYMNTATSIPWALFLLPIGIQLLIGLFYMYLRCTMHNSSPYSALRED